MKLYVYVTVVTAVNVTFITHEMLFLAGVLVFFERIFWLMEVFAKLSKLLLLFSGGGDG